MRKKTNLLYGLTLAIAALNAFEAHEALLSLDGVDRVSSIVSSPANLTTEGTLDWSYWAPASGTGLTAPVGATNEKLLGDIISGLSNVGGAICLAIASISASCRRMPSSIAGW